VIATQNNAMILTRAWQSWQLGGLTDFKTGRLGGNTHPLSSWVVPTDIDIEGDRLCWDASFSTYRTVHGPAKVLDELVKITVDTSQQKVADFARRWGVVGLCREHMWPHVHSRYPGGGDEEVYGCTLLGGRRPFIPIEWYRQLAQRSRSVLNIASRLHRGIPGEPEDWEVVVPEVAHWDDTVINTRWKQVPYTKAARVADERDALGDVLDRWLDLTRTRIRFSWVGEHPTFGLAASGLVSAVFMSLAFSAARSGGLAVCSNCGRAYTPARRPAAGRRCYCTDEQCQKARVRDAQYDKRARDRRGAS